MEKANIDKVVLWLLIVMTAMLFIGVAFMFGQIELGSLLTLLIVWWTLFGVMWLFATKWRSLCAYIGRVLRHQRKLGAESISVRVHFLAILLGAIALVIYFYGDTYLQIALHSPDSERIAGGALTVLLFSIGKIIGYHRSGHDHETDMEQSIGLTV